MAEHGFMDRLSIMERKKEAAAMFLGCPRLDEIVTSCVCSPDLTRLHRRTRLAVSENTRRDVSLCSSLAVL